MAEFDLEAIRARVTDGEVIYQDQIDRYELLAAYDALAAAARKVTCGRCCGDGDQALFDGFRNIKGTAPCPDCSDLRKLLEGER